MTKDERAATESIGRHPDIELSVNGESRRAAAGATLGEFLVDHALDPDLVVVERNGEIVPRARFDDLTLDAGDTLEIVHFVGGG